MTKRLYLVRHGEVNAPAGVFLGKTDAELSDEGRGQGGWLAGRLKDLPVDRCFCSPLRRAQQTASYIAESLGLPIETHDALREIDFGHWEGRRFDDIAAEDPQSAQLWCEKAHDFTFPAGDAVVAFVDRVRNFASQLRQQDGENLLLVTHGGVIRTLLVHLLDLKLEDQFKFEVVRGSLSIVQMYEGGALLTRLNDHG